MARGDFGHLDALPDDTHDTFMWLCQDVARLYQKWDFYLGLFDDKSNCSVMGALPLAFGIIEESLRADMTMAVCRLSDPAESCQRENLNFRSLEAFFDHDTELTALIDGFAADCASVRLHRNKLVGHSDKSVRLGSEPAMIPEIAKSDIDTILRSAAAILNHVAARYAGTQFGFAHPGAAGADVLIRWLKKGMEQLEVGR